MKILFVARPGSVHAARWITLFKDTGWDLAVFPASPEKPHALLAGVRVFDECRSSLERQIRFFPEWPMHRRGVTQMRRWCEQASARWFAREVRLAQTIRRFRPDLVHSLEIQHAGYLTMRARAGMAGRFPYWIVQNWGSDISLFQHLPGHPERIRELLATCDGYDCECRRDVDLARAFGFRGTIGPVRPNTGGYDLTAAAAWRAPGPPSARRVIALKGYQGWAGRALVALNALEQNADRLAGYRVVIYSALTEDVIIAGRLFQHRTGLPVEFLPNNSPHDRILALHGAARFSIGLSISDGISTSLLEAMIMGSLPIQSGTGAAADWIEDGRSGLLVPAEDPAAVAHAVRRALSDDVLVDGAAEINARIATDRLDRARIGEEAIAWYRYCAAIAAER